MERAAVAQDDAMVVILTEEDRLIQQLIDRLLNVYPRVSERTVTELVGSVHGRFDQAKIRDFIPLFVERRTKEKLAALTAGVDHA
jgi:Rad3-related DNA helicase